MTKITKYVCDQCGAEYSQAPEYAVTVVKRDFISGPVKAVETFTSKPVGTVKRFKVMLMGIIRETETGLRPDLCVTCFASILFEHLDALGLKRPEGVTE